MLELLDWPAYAFILLGYFRLIKKKRDGWAWTAIGSTCLVAFGLSTPNALGVAAGNAVFLVIATIGYVKWSEKKK